MSITLTKTIEMVILSMKEPIFVSSVLVLVGMPLICIISGVAVIPFSWQFSLFCFGLALLWCVPTIVLRKSLFKKILITEDGIKTFYRANIIKSIKWEEIVETRIVFAFNPYICFSKGKLIEKPKRWQLPKHDSIVSVNLFSKAGQEILRYKEKIKNSIKDIELLPKHWQKALS